MAIPRRTRAASLVLVAAATAAPAAASPCGSEVALRERLASSADLGVELVLAGAGEESWSDEFASVRTVYRPTSPRACADGRATCGTPSEVFLTHVVNKYDKLAPWTVFASASAPTEATDEALCSGPGAAPGSTLLPHASLAGYLAAGLGDCASESFAPARCQVNLSAVQWETNMPHKGSKRLSWEDHISERCAGTGGILANSLRSRLAELGDGDVVRVTPGGAVGVSAASIRARPRKEYVAMLKALKSGAGDCLTALFDVFLPYLVGATAPEEAAPRMRGAMPRGAMPQKRLSQVFPTPVVRGIAVLSSESAWEHGAFSSCHALKEPMRDMYKQILNISRQLLDVLCEPLDGDMDSMAGIEVSSTRSYYRIMAYVGGNSAQRSAAKALLDLMNISVASKPIAAAELEKSLKSRGYPELAREVQIEMLGKSIDIARYSPRQSTHGGFSFKIKPNIDTTEATAAPLVRRAARDAVKHLSQASNLIDLVVSCRLALQRYDFSELIEAGEEDLVVHRGRGLSEKGEGHPHRCEYRVYGTDWNRVNEINDRLVGFNTGDMQAAMSTFLRLSHKYEQVQTLQVMDWERELKKLEESSVQIVETHVNQTGWDALRAQAQTVESVHSDAWTVRATVAVMVAVLAAAVQ